MFIWENPQGWGFSYTQQKVAGTVNSTDTLLQWTPDNMDSS